MPPGEMRLLCPACQTPLPALAIGAEAIPCTACGVEVDAARLATVAGKPRLVAERDFTGLALPGLRVEARIGAGGMGSVYRAVGDDGAARAVKFLSPAMAAVPEVVERFSREIKLLATLDHPRIVKVRGQGELEGIPWFAMDLVEGPTLAARLAQGPLTVDEARTLFPSLFAALAHAHERGVVHRDLKPANILLSPDGPAIADFGIAHLDLDFASRQTQLTQTHAILGTYPYMSPEQRAGRPVDHRSDLYSMGVLLYEALAGTRPEGAFSPLRGLRPELSGAVDGVVSRLLQPNREARLASAAEAGRLVAAALAPRHRRRARAWLGGTVAAAAAGVWLLWGVGPSSRPDPDVPSARQSSTTTAAPTSGIPSPIQPKEGTPTPSPTPAPPTLPQAIAPPTAQAIAPPATPLPGKNRLGTPVLPGKAPRAVGKPASSSGPVDDVWRKKKAAAEAEWEAKRLKKSSAKAAKPKASSKRKSFKAVDLFDDGLKQAGP